MSEKTKPTFLERLNAVYPGQFELKRKEGIPPQDHAIFSPKNKHFGIIDIYGDFDEWRDEDDYFVEDEDGVYHDADTCGFCFYAMGTGKVYILSPEEIFDMLEKIFFNNMICYTALIAKKRRLYEIEELKKLLKEGKVRRKKTYRFWSGDYPIPD